MKLHRKKSILKKYKSYSNKNKNILFFKNLSNLKKLIKKKNKIPILINLINLKN